MLQINLVMCSMIIKSFWDLPKITYSVTKIITAFKD